MCDLSSFLFLFLCSSPSPFLTLHTYLLYMKASVPMPIFPVWVSRVIGITLKLYTTQIPLYRIQTRVQQTSGTDNSDNNAFFVFHLLAFFSFFPRRSPLPLSVCVTKKRNPSVNQGTVEYTLVCKRKRKTRFV